MKRNNITGKFYKMKNPLVSIIVAVYNAEPFLPRCLDSLLGQTYRNIEVIAVDDCSTDGSLSVLRRYAERDGRLRVLCQQHNGGAPAARNRAMTVARGELMSTVDADDWIATDAIEKAVAVFENNEEVDIVTYSLVCVYDDGREVPMQIRQDLPRRMSGREACYWTLHWDISGLDVVRSQLEKRFFAEADYGQYGDETTTHIVFYHARLVVLGDGWYYYYQNPESYTRKVSVKRFEMLECRESLRRHLTDLGAEERFIRRLDVKRWYELMELCGLYWSNRRTFTEQQRCDIMARLKATYTTFRRAHLPLKVVTRPLCAPMPCFWLFYIEQILKRRLKTLIRKT